MDGGVTAFVVAIIIVAVFVFIAIALTGKRGHKFDVEEYQARFLAIENKLSKDNPVSYTVAIISGDKLLDRALIEMGAPGKTMGERLKKTGSKFTDLNAVWRAHKLRNVIAHEDDIELTYRQAASALAIYKQALKDLGAI